MPKRKLVLAFVDEAHYPGSSASPPDSPLAWGYGPVSPPYSPSGSRERSPSSQLSSYAGERLETDIPPPLHAPRASSPPNRPNSPATDVNDPIHLDMEETPGGGRWVIRYESALGRGRYLSSRPLEYCETNAAPGDDVLGLVGAEVGAVLHFLYVDDIQGWWVWKDGEGYRFVIQGSPLIQAY